MNLAELPAPRPIADDEGTYTPSEVASSIHGDVAELLESIHWHAETLAGCPTLTPAQAAVGAELLATARRCSELAHLLQLTAR